MRDRGDRGDHDRAAPIFQLLVDCFDRYADGYNYLGLIALARSDFATAIARFEKTIELGRKLFPASIGKKRYWADHDTRPYMRGLRNLTIALVEAGRFDEALKVCGRLEHECGDIESASWHRATIGLNTRDWEPASEGEGFMELDAARGFSSRLPSTSEGGSIAWLRRSSMQRCGFPGRPGCSPTRRCRCASPSHTTTRRTTIPASHYGVRFT